jgi:hypothetical protein
MRRGKAVAALVPVEDLDVLERLDDEADVKEARRRLAALKRGTETTVALEDVADRLASDGRKAPSWATRGPSPAVRKARRRPTPSAAWRRLGKGWATASSVRS